MRRKSHRRVARQESPVVANMEMLEPRMLLSTVPALTVEPWPNHSLPMLTNQGSPMIWGTVSDPSAAMTVTIAGVDYTPKVGSDGNWWLPAGTIGPLGEGTYDIIAKGTNSAGTGTDPTTNELVVDQTAPAVTINGPFYTHDRSPAFSGTVDDHNADILVSLNGVNYIATNNADGTWTLPAGTVPTMDNGNYGVAVAAYDKAGNVDRQTTIVTVQGLDAVPNVTIENDPTTTDPKPLIWGNVDDVFATIVVTVNGQSYNATLNSIGNWWVSKGDITLPPGTYDIAVAATNIVGVGTTHKQLTVLPPANDTTPPTSSVTSATYDQANSAIDLAWDGQDNTGGSGLAAFDILVSVDGGSPQVIFNHTTKSNGSYNVTAGHKYDFYSIAYDNSGNAEAIGTTPDQTVDLRPPDTTAPTSSVTGATYNQSTSSIHLTWSGQDNAGGSGLASYDIFVSTDGGAPQKIFNKTANTSGDYNVQQGHTYGFYSVAYDVAGNAETIGANPDKTVDLTVPPPTDTTAPTSSVTGATYSQSKGLIHLTWSGKDESGGSGLASYDILVSIDGGDPQIIFDHSTKTSGDYAAQQGHIYGFYSVAYDKAGNAETIGDSPDKTVDLTGQPPADTTPPTSTVTSATYNQTNSTVHLIWSGQDNSGGSGLANYDILVSIDGGTPQSIFNHTTNTSGDYAVQQGHTYGFFSVAYDNAGNAENIGANPDKTVDLTVPPPTDTTPPDSSVTGATYSQSKGQIHLTWSGQDNSGGSGLASYDILVSIDGDTPQVIFDHTTKTSGYYAVQPGHVYDFYSVAYDKAGNAENIGVDPDQSVDLTSQPPSDTTAPTSSVTAATYDQGTSNVHLSWSGKDNTGGSGLASYDILVSVDGGSPQLLFSQTTQTSGDYTCQTGHTYGFYSIAYDNAGNVEALAATPDASVNLTGYEQIVLSGVNRSYKFTDADGTLVTLKYTGPGTATFERDNNPATGSGDLVSLVIDGSTSRSAVTITTKGRGSSTAIGSITANGDLKSISAGTTDLLGDVGITGGLASLKLRNITGPHTISIGAPTAPKTTATLTLGQVQDLTLASGTAIRTFSAGSLTDGDGVVQTITAPSIGTFTVKGDMLNTIVDLQNTTAATAIKSLTVAGWLSDSRVLASGILSSIRVGGLANTDIYAGVNAGVTGLPNPTGDINLLDTVAIKKLTVTGAVQDHGHSTINSNIAAPILGSITLNRTDPTAGQAWGLAGHKLTRLTCNQDSGKYVWPNTDPDMGAFNVNLG